MRSLTSTTHIRITGTHRDPLREALLVDLADLADLGRLIETRRMSEARGYRDRFVRDMRLLDDLGWEEDDPRQRFELTMPAAELKALLLYLREVAEAELRFRSENLASARGARDRIDLDLDTVAACTAVLYGLRHPNGDSNGNGAPSMADADPSRP